MPYTKGQAVTYIEANGQSYPAEVMRVTKDTLELRYQQGLVWYPVYIHKSRWHRAIAARGEG